MVNPHHFTKEMTTEFEEKTLIGLDSWFTSVTGAIDKISENKNDLDVLKTKVQAIAFTRFVRGDLKNSIEIQKTFSENEVFSSLYVMQSAKNYERKPPSNLIEQLRKVIFDKKSK